MLILRLAFRNLLRRTRRTVLMGSLICVGIGGLFVANAVFESTNRGLRTSFVRSLTGDVVLGARGETQYSLFGSEIPIISEFETIPQLPDYAKIERVLRENENVERWTPIVSAAASLQVGGTRRSIPVFGVDPHSYFAVNPDIEIVSGETAALADGGVFLNRELHEHFVSSLGRELEIGEEMVFTTFTNEGFRSRRGSFAGVHGYVSSTETLDRVALADPTIVRGLIDYTLGFGRRDAVDETAPVADDFDLMDLFEDDSDIYDEIDTEPLDAPPDDPFRNEGLDEEALFGDEVFDDGAGDVVTDERPFMLSEVEAALAETENDASLVMTDAGAWSFVLIRAREGRSGALYRDLVRTVQRGELDARVMTWRDAAGMAAQAVFALQIAFYTGLFFIAAAAVLVIMNALVISVLERSSEIGTMRGIGAGSSFIRRLFVAESLLLTMSSAALGVVLGVAVSLVVAESGIRLENELLITLFGGEVIRPLVSVGAVVLHLGIAAVVGALAWIYPVSVATRIQPASAMTEG